MRQLDDDFDGVQYDTFYAPSSAQLEADEIRREVNARARKPRRVSKAQQLVDSGLADSLADARAQLRDMGE
jgi:hypothetical protein